MREVPKSRLKELPLLIAGVSLGFQALIKRLHSELRIRAKVPVGMGSIFFALEEADGCIMKDLGTRLRMPKGTLSGLLGVMESSGWIRRCLCPHDGRALRITLTAKGHVLAPKMRERHARTLRSLETGMKPSDLTALSRLLSRLLENLRGEGFPPGKNLTLRPAIPKRISKKPRTKKSKR